MRRKLKDIQMRMLIALIALAGAFSVITSCNENSEIGSVLTDDEISIVVDSSFTITTQTVASDAVISRTVMQLLGVIDAPDYGYIRSDFVTQFMPSNAFDTVGISAADVDSLKLVMLVSTGNITGDSLALMGLEVYPLSRQLQAPIYSNFDPAGYYETTPIGSLVYNLAKNSEPESLQENDYVTLSVDLPVELGRKFFTEYVNNASTFASPTAFAKFFPGLYVKNSYGSGRLTRIGNTTMQLYYHRSWVNDQGNDTTVNKVGSYFAVTPEIITNNDITLNIASSITDRVNQGEAIMLVPAGLEVEMRFPAPEIIATYKAGIKDAIGVVNSLSMSIPVEEISNKYGIGIPENVLLVLKKDLDEFFRDSKLPDNLTSFTASVTALDDGTLVYPFADMRDYIVNLLKKDEITADDYTFILVPITLTTEYNTDYYGNVTTTVTGIVPSVTEPRMGRIVTESTKIKFVYSKQTTNF